MKKKVTLYLKDSLYGVLREIVYVLHMILFSINMKLCITNLWINNPTCYCRIFY